MREGVETSSFEQALDEEEKQGLRIIRGGDFSFNYIRQGFVARPLQRYIELFGRERVLILFYDDLVQDPDIFMQRLFDFLGVDSGFRGNWTHHYNPSCMPRFNWLHQLLDGENAWRQPMAVLACIFLPERWRTPLWHRLRDWNVYSGQRLAMADETRQRLLKLFAKEIDAEEEVTGRNLEAWRNGQLLHSG